MCDNAAGFTRKLEHNAKLSNTLLNTSDRVEKFSKSFCSIMKQLLYSHAWRTLMIEENPEVKLRVRDWDNGGVFSFMERK